MVMRSESYLLLLFRYMREMAKRADGAVTCRFTLAPYFMLEVLF
jgi:hypothetical protein